MVTTFENIRDEMPNGRQKTINSVGYHAQIEFNPRNENINNFMHIDDS